MEKMSFGGLLETDILVESFSCLTPPFPPKVLFSWDPPFDPGLMDDSEVDPFSGFSVNPPFDAYFGWKVGAL